MDCLVDFSIACLDDRLMVWLLEQAPVQHLLGGGLAHLAVLHPLSVDAKRSKRLAVGLT